MRDYGRDGNIEKYNSTQPPFYNLSNVIAPITAYVGGADVVAPPQVGYLLADFLSFNLQTRLFHP